MIIYIETKYKLEITECFWSTSEFRGTLVKLYRIGLYDQRSKAELHDLRVHRDEILHHINELLPNYYLQIRNEIKAKFNLD
jgi:hypothetical protein